MSSVEAVMGVSNRAAPPDQGALSTSTGEVTGSVQKKPRGRPRTRVQPCTVIPRTDSSPLNADAEVTETWNTAKLLGVSSNDEPAVLSHLRQSKKLMIMESGSRPHG